MNNPNIEQTAKKENNNEFSVKLYFKDSGLQFKEIIKDNFTQFITSKYLK